MRVLQLTTYPLRRPRHGGQIRAAELRRAIESAGHEVRSLAVYPEEAYASEQVGPDDIAFPSRSPHRNRASPYLSDLDSGQFLAQDEAAYARFATLMRAYAPDVVTLEQCYLWPALRRYIGENPVHSISVVNSSQNVEHALKRAMIGGSDASIDTAIDSIRAIEAELAQRAHLTIACTARDAAELVALGARNVIVAENGTVLRTPGEAALHSWRTHLQGIRYALFVGSAHPPNADGFWDMFAPSLAFLPPDQCVIAVGGVCSLLVEHPAFHRWSQINASRLRCAGAQEDDALAALIALAACVVLPITSGGGSNIKTAEAVVNADIVIGTGTSFRGYPGAEGLPGVYRADDAASFRGLVGRALDGTLAARTPADRDGRDRFLWPASLAAVPAALAQLRQRGGF